ncbi:MAG TPA: PEP-CTERM sorting domain-containing protein [Lacipirellulaceae bacterium]|nr:PEP-CTERM sorting domain-containing protein [Lacipirellulaceae bacterium]
MILRRSRRLALPLLSWTAVAALASPASAAFHLWKIQEIFTNLDGSVQFIELFCPTGANNEQFVANHSITATSDGVPVVFNLNHNLSTALPTGGRTFLVATPAYGTLPGAVAADFGTLPTSFFNPAAASIRIDFSGVDAVTFSGGILPKDGRNSLVDHDPAGFGHLLGEFNSPRNFAGQNGVIDAGPQPLAGDFDESGTVSADDLINWTWGHGRTGDATHAHGDADKDLDVDGNDFVLWQRQLGRTQGAAAAAASIPEPGAAALVGTCLLAAARRRRQ